MVRRDGCNGYGSQCADRRDKAAVRASGFYSRVAGYTDNVVTGERNVDTGKIYGGRVDLLAKPTADLSVRLTAFAQNIQRDGGNYASISLAGVPVAGSLDQVHPLQEPFRSAFAACQRQHRAGFRRRDPDLRRQLPDPDERMR